MNQPVSSTVEDSTRTRLIWIALGVGIIMGGVLIVFLMSKPAPIEGVVIHGRQLRGHTNQLVMTPAGMPPVGGIHHNDYQNCGVYTSPIPDEHAIHSLEHGAVWITFNPELPDADIIFLQNLAQKHSFLLMSPYPTQDHPLVLTAWGVQLTLDSADDSRINAFIARYQLGPTAPEVGASCDHGVGIPLP